VIEITIPGRGNYTIENLVLDLNGTIAAMFCLGLNIEEAVRTGVFIHGISGDLASKEKGPDGMTAQDILDFLPCAVRYYRENLARISESLCDTIHVV